MVTLTNRVVLYPLPHKIKGFVCADEDGTETYVLNARLTRESNQETMLHEIKHSKNNDLYRECCVTELETVRHKEV